MERLSPTNNFIKFPHKEIFVYMLSICDDVINLFSLYVEDISKCYEFLTNDKSFSYLK